MLDRLYQHADLVEADARGRQPPPVFARGAPSNFMIGWGGWRPARSGGYLDVAIAEATPKGQPDTLTEDIDGKTVARAAHRVFTVIIAAVLGLPDNTFPTRTEQIKLIN